ncbi:hypothetical protein [Nitrosospira sp. Nl5]|uniref:hypothetical protein n=1 Tax=Nitrosospira sp. Nl5 TaxID=200120 RepID=UPI00115FA9D1|nr:hypothetical protein [Nitrosospira sp. Nl5]
MKSPLWAIPFLASCSSMTADYKSNDTEKGSGIYSITSLYGGGLRSRETTIEFMDIDARNMCNSEYTIIDEKTLPVMNRLGEVRVSRLTWKIKCNSEAEAAPP